MQEEQKTEGTSVQSPARLILIGEDHTKTEGIELVYQIMVANPNTTILLEWDEERLSLAWEEI
jgi:hypothetical protein